MTAPREDWRDGARDAAVDDLIELSFPVDPVLTLAELRHGASDPTIRFEHGVVWRASLTTEGPATMRIAPARDRWRLTGWGPGAGAAARAVPRLLGAEDDPAALRLTDERLRRLAARLGGLRFGRSDDAWASLVPAILGQKVTGTQALRSWHGLLGRFGEAAPGPRQLRLPPRPEVVADLRYEQLHPFGVEQRRALTLIRAARRAAWLQEAASLHRGAALARLRSIPGVGPWTAAEVARPAFGDPDAVSLGDYHLPNLVCWALAGEPRGDDERMLELLEPYRGQRARLVRILEHSGIHPPRFGPRLSVRSIEGM